jgi:hypothetical protein
MLAYKVAQLSLSEVDEDARAHMKVGHTLIQLKGFTTLLLLAQSEYHIPAFGSAANNS